MGPVLKYPGAKNRLSKWICSYIPAHDVYVEPFAGSLGVLFEKPRSHIETVNDIDGDIVNFFRVLRDRPDELGKKIVLTPYSRGEYNNAYTVSNEDDSVERARKFCVRCWMGFGNGNLYRNGFRSGQQSVSPNPSRSWQNLPETMYEAAERLKGVQIEQLPALELMKRYNTPDVFAYLDPPYLPATRKGNLYKHEMSESEHEKLLKVIVAHPGKILISGYDNALYNEYLEQWTKVSINTRAEKGVGRTEVLWMNYHMQQMSLEEFMGG